MITFDYGIKFSPPQAAKNMGFLCKEGGGSEQCLRLITEGGEGGQALAREFYSKLFLALCRWGRGGDLDWLVGWVSWLE